MKPKMLCFVTGSRAEYGLMKSLIQKAAKDVSLSTRLIVTGSHLSSKHGMSVAEIEKDGIKIDERVPILTENDSPLGVVEALGEAVKGLGAALQRLNPDIIVLLGDRYETFAAAQAALLLKIPIAHIAGGDVTEGAFDEAIRHSISKMAQWHFATHQEAALRLIQLGESASKVFNAGSPAVDQIHAMERLGRAEIEMRTGFKFLEKNILMTFHPVTLGRVSSVDQIKQLLAALDTLGDRVGILITGPNADPEGLALRKLIEEFVRTHSNAKFHASLGQQLYWNVMAEVDAVVGNSSSGFYEAPTFKKTTVNVGDRQKGRLHLSSILDCEPEKNKIVEAIRKAFAMDCSRTQNPYGDGHAADRILETLKWADARKENLQKHFFDIYPSETQKVFIIAEAGVNHNGSLETAKQLVDAAKKAGADAVKFQTFSASRLVTDSAGKADYQSRGASAGETQKKMLEKLELSESAHKELQDYCQKIGIEFMSSAFDIADLKFLVQTLKVKRLKIPSGEITNAPYLVEVGRSKLPFILSTGMCSAEEIEQALGAIAYGWQAPVEPPSAEAFRKALWASDFLGIMHDQITLLQCTSQYPAPDEAVHLLAMDYLKHRFHLKTGLSDHTSGIDIAVAAAGRGAVMIEKHLTLDKKMSGPDHAASLDPAEFKALVTAVRRVEKSLGRFGKAEQACEADVKAIARKSVVASRAIKAGEVFSEDNISIKRPADGLAPMQYWKVLKSKAPKDFQKDERILL